MANEYKICLRCGLCCMEFDVGYGKPCSKLKYKDGLYYCEIYEDRPIACKNYFHKCKHSPFCANGLRKLRCQ